MKKSLKIGILSRGKDLYSTRRLVEAGEERGHDVQVIDTLRCYMNISTGKPSVFYKGEPLIGFDAIVPRIGASITFYGTAVVRQFEMMGTYSLNSSLSISHSRDKLRALQLLSREGVGLPATWFAHAPSDIPHIMDHMPEAPMVAKLLEGTQGKGVVLVDNKKNAMSMIEAFMDLKANLMMQEFIAEADGADVRCLVVDGKVVGAIERRAKDGEFRSNLHLGGTAHKVQVSKEIEETALKASKVMGLNVAGVDILRSKRGPVVIEVNSSPGLEGVEKASGQDIATPIIKHIEKSSGRQVRPKFSFFA